MAKESEAQRGKMTCPVSHSTWRQIKDSNSLGPNLSLLGMTPEDRQAVVTAQLPALSGPMQGYTKPLTPVPTLTHQHKQICHGPLVSVFCASLHLSGWANINVQIW